MLVGFPVKQTFGPSFDPKYFFDGFFERGFDPTWSF
jgi:hypothetical protein